MIRNIILDFGGVIIEVDYCRVVQSFEQLGARNFERLYAREAQTVFFDDFETGRLSETEFRDYVRKYLPEGVHDEQIDAAWNSMVGTIPVERMRFLQRLRKHYRLFLLSNTNPIHVTGFMQKLSKQYGDGWMNELFERVYLSCQAGIRKPEAGIFQLLMSEAGLHYNETIFIDDSIQHVEGARKAGLTALHLDTSKFRLEEFLPGILAGEPWNISQR